jgi:hypothetical protein
MKFSLSALLMSFVLVFSTGAFAGAKVDGIQQDCTAIPTETIVVYIEKIKELCFAKKVKSITRGSVLDNFVSMHIEKAENIPVNYLDAGVKSVIRFESLNGKIDIFSNVYITFEDNTRIERNIKVESERLNMAYDRDRLNMAYDRMARSSTPNLEKNCSKSTKGC